MPVTRSETGEREVRDDNKEDNGKTIIEDDESPLRLTREAFEVCLYP